LIVWAKAQDPEIMAERFRVAFYIVGPRFFVTDKLVAASE
jgi:hypothetical protein